MSRFSIFTIILAISIITITADLFIRDYVASKGQTSTLTSEKTDQKKDAAEVSVERKAEEKTPENVPKETSTETLLAEEGLTEDSVVKPEASLTLSQDLVNQAGFLAVLREKPFSGKLYELLDVSKNPVSGIGNFELMQEGAPIAALTEIALPDEIRALELYILLQNKTKPYIDLTLNETNAYGDRSFYINHAKKADEAFLTIKIGTRLYALAYVKLYHPQIKKLVELLTP